jgi:signal transduction histidine kinase
MTAVNGSAGHAPTRRTGLIADGILAAALAALLPVATYFALRHQAGDVLLNRLPHRRGVDNRPFDAGTVALVIASAGTLALRRRYPVAVLALVFGTTLIYFVLGYANGPIWLALLIAYYTATACGHRRAAVTAAVAGFAIFPWLDYLLRNRPAPTLADLAGLAAWLLMVLGASEAIRARRERAAAAARIRAEEARRRASEERLRMARELHDSLGHYLSLISVQSGVALNLNQQLPEQARAALAAVKQASKDALRELRSALDILRQDGEPIPRSPAPALARLGDLVAQATAPELDVRAETEGTVRPLPFGVDVAAYRIVQEALTNVTRHAGPATATVHVTYGQEDLTVQIDDDGRGPAPRPQPATGNGITGMQERAAALGGELYAGPRPGGGFRVRARLPLNGTP